MFRLAALATFILISPLHAATLEGEFQFRQEVFFDCADAEIGKLKASRDSAEAIRDTVLLNCEKEASSVLDLAPAMYEREQKRRLRGGEADSLKREGIARLREVTLGRVVETRAAR